MQLTIIDSTEMLSADDMARIQQALEEIIALAASENIADWLDSGAGDLGAESHALEILATRRDGLLEREIELLFIDEKEMRELNAQYMGKDYATDVLSFPLTQDWGQSCGGEMGEIDTQELEQEIDNFERPPLGSILINLPLSQRESHNRGHTLIQEISLLFAHALLHLLGFDHESDQGEHRALESMLITLAKLPPSLIERNS